MRAKGGCDYFLRSSSEMLDCGHKVYECVRCKLGKVSSSKSKLSLACENVDGVGRRKRGCGKETLCRFRTPRPDSLISSDAAGDYIQPAKLRVTSLELKNHVSAEDSQWLVTLGKLCS